MGEPSSTGTIIRPGIGGGMYLVDRKETTVSFIINLAISLLLLKASCRFDVQQTDDHFFFSSSYMILVMRGCSLMSWSHIIAFFRRSFSSNSSSATKASTSTISSSVVSSRNSYSEIAVHWTNFSPFLARECPAYDISKASVFKPSNLLNTRWKIMLIFLESLS